MSLLLMKFLWISIVGSLLLGAIPFDAVLASCDKIANSPNGGATAQSTEAKHPSHWQWTLSLRNRTGFRLDEPRVFQMARAFFEPRGIYKLSSQWRLTLEGRAHYDPVGRLGYPKKLWFDPRQFLLDGRIRSVHASLGLQQIVWGQADGLRVLDVINPLDYREFILEDFLDSRRPLWALRTDVPIERGSLQFIWIPYFVPGRLPVGENEFALGASFGLALISSASGSLSSASFSLMPTWRPAYRLSSSQVGLRYSRSQGRWDLTANYFKGWEDVPTPYWHGFDRQPPPLQSRLILAPRFDRKEIFGGTAATSLSSVVLRLEAGWNSRKATPVIAGPSNGFEKLGQFSSVVGLDHSPRPWLWLSGQYFLQFISASQRSLLFARYNQLASIYVRTNFFRDTLKPELFVLVGLNQRQYLVRPRIVKTFGDHWSVGLGADWLGGRPINPFGFLSSRDRAVVELKWTD